METKEPDSRLSVRKEDLEDQELYNLNKIINDLYSKITTARDETDDAVKKFTRSGVISSVSDQSAASLPPLIEGEIPQPQASDWTLNPVVYSAGEDGLQYGFASAAINSKPAVVDYYSMFIQDYSSGYVNTLGTTVTLTAASKEAGNTFENCVKDQVININSVAYILAADAVAPFESVTITSSAGTQTNVYFNLNPVDGKWEEIASNAEAGTWQLRPPTGWDVPCCLTASTKDQKTFEPPTGVNYKRLQFTAWGNAPQVTNFLVEIENQPPATTDIPSAKFVVNFTKPLDPEYYYASIERLQFATNAFTGVIGPTAVVTASGTTITYSSSSSLYATFNFKGQYFTHLQVGDTVYVGNASSVTTSNNFTVAEVISNTQIRLQSAPGVAGDLLFAQWGRIAGEIDPFTQTDYWPLPTTAEYWTFRSRSVNHREVANDTSPPPANVTVPASGGITPLTPATPLGPSDWALSPLQTSTDEAGNSYVFISATITTPSPNADYYSLFWQKTTAPTSGDWIEIAADATAGTWQPWPAEGADYAVAIAANKNTYKLQQPQNPIINATDLTSAQNGQVYVITTSGSTNFTLIGAASSAVGTVFTKSGGTGSGSGAVSKAVSIPAWGDANQVTNFSVSVETDNKAGVESGRFVVNFDPPVDLDYYYTSIERLLYDVTTSPPWPAGSNIGATAIVDVNSSTRVITYTTVGWPSGFVGQKFAYIQDGDTVYLGTASTLTDSNAYTVEEVISSTQLKLTTIPGGSPTGVLFAQWGRVAGEVNPFTQVDYWPLPGGNGERWKFRARSVNYRRRANNVSPPTYDVVVSASSGVNLVDMVKTTSNPTWLVDGGTVVIKSTNTNAPIEVNNTNALVLSTGYVGPNQIGVRNATSGNFYPYATLNRSTGSGWASLNTYGGPLLTTTDSWASIYASTIPANSYALFRNMPIKVGDSSGAGGTTVIDEYRRGFFTDLNASVFRLGTTATAGYVLTTDASGIGTWQAAPSGYISSINSMTGPAITIAAGSGISIASATNTVTITNSGVTSITGTTNQVIASASTGSVTLSLPQDIATTSNVTFGSVTTATVGPTTLTALNLRTDNTIRWSVSSAGMFVPAASDTYDIGILSTNRVRAVYTKIVDTAASGGTGDYAQTRKIQLFDNTGSTSSPAFWDLNVVASGIGAFSESYFYMRDNAGNKVFQSERVRSGSAVDRTFWYTDLLPDANLSQSIGDSGTRWNNIYGAAMDLTGNLSAAVINATGSPAYRVSGATVIDASRNGTFVNLNLSGTIDFGSTASSKVILYTSTASAKYEIAIASGSLRVIKDFNTSKISFGYGWSGGYTEQVYIDSSRFSVGNLNIYSSSGVIVSEGHFDPQSSGTYDLGSFLRWRNVYTGGLNLTGAISSGGSTGTSGQLLASTGTGVQWQNIASRLSAGTGISISGTTTATITNSGVTSITGTSNQVIASAPTGSVTLSLPQSIATTSDVTFNKLTLSTGASNGLIMSGYGTVLAHANTDLYLDNVSGDDIYIRPTASRYVIVGRGNDYTSRLIPNGNDKVQLGEDGNAWSAVYSYAYYAHNGTSWSAGWTGTFSTGSQTVTVQDGIITNVA